MANEEDCAKISVIIPVFNVGSYLVKCIESVLNQTMKDIEILLVDDGSFDNSGVICDDYAAHDNRIRVIHKRNEGLSRARNIGIDASTAPYIMFVDGDDWVEPKFCEEPYYTAELTGADIVFYTYNNINNNNESSLKKLKNKPGMLCEAEAIDFNICFSSAVWLGLYRRELFDTIRFPDGKYYEEVGTSHRLIHNANRIMLINSALYNHRINRKNSITTSPETRDHGDKKEMILKRMDDLFSWGYDGYAIMDAYRMLLKYGCQRLDQKPFVETVRRIKGRTPNVFNWRQRIMLAVLRISPKLFDNICIIRGIRTK